MTRMNTKMRLTPTHRKESIQITIPTGRDAGLLTSPQFKLFRVNLYSCLVFALYECIFVFPPYFKQLVFDAFGNGSVGVGQPEIILPNGRI